MFISYSPGFLSITPVTNFSRSADKHEAVRLGTL